MLVDLRNAQRRVRVDTARLRRVAATVIEQLGFHDAELSVLLVDDREMARLHGRWMDDPTPTDVMSFPSEGIPSARHKRKVGGAVLLGDIVISTETAARRARAGVLREIVRYLIHGLLHLIGHDHVRIRERARMNREARRLMRGVAPMLS